MQGSPQDSLLRKLWNEDDQLGEKVLTLELRVEELTSECQALQEALDQRQVSGHPEEAEEQRLSLSDRLQRLAEEEKQKSKELEKLHKDWNAATVNVKHACIRYRNDKTRKAIRDQLVQDLKEFVFTTRFSPVLDTFGF